MVKTPSSSPGHDHYISGLAFKRNRLQSLFSVWKIALTSYPDLRSSWKAFWHVAVTAFENNRIRHLQKGFVFDDRVYTLMGLPGRPSPAFDRMVKSELHKVVPIPGFSGSLAVLVFAFTKKCPMRCEHCVEWEALNQKEALSKAEIIDIVRKFQDYGVAQIELSGGEPLNRFEDMVALLQQSDIQQTDFWMLTSGFHLTIEKATQLKAAGLKGVSISLDHWNASDHDRFRGTEGAFDWALKAVHNAREAGLIVGLSLVPTHDFCTMENFRRYATLAHDLKVHVIRILEPRAVGHYAGKPVELNQEELAICEAFVRTMQRDAQYNDYPIIEYHSTYQRKVGCGGAGKRYLYVDTDGDIHTCPFCRHKLANALTQPIQVVMEQLKKGTGCPVADFQKRPVRLQQTELANHT